MVDEVVEWKAWRDYSTGTSKFLLNDDCATIFVAISAICFTLCEPYLFRIFRTIYLARLRGIRSGSFLACLKNQFKKHYPKRFGKGNRGSDPETIPVLHDASLSAGRADPDGNKSLDGVAALYQRSTGGRDYIWRFLSNGNGAVAEGYIVFFVILGRFAFWTWFTLFVAGKIKLDGTAVWSSDVCGPFEFDSQNAGTGASIREGIITREKESRAGEYARSCYVQPEVYSSTPCDFFAAPAINYTIEKTYEKCPFAERSVCMPRQQSITFSTGLVSADQMGINTPSPYLFNRTTSCAPLSQSERFVRNETIDGVTYYYYHYGQIVDQDSNPPGVITDYTYYTAGNPINSSVAAYDLVTEATSWTEGVDPWVPVPELKPPEGATVTIVFVSALRIFYEEHSSDAIFPADGDIPWGPDDKPWWWKTDPRARAFACVDETHVCKPDRQTCWTMVDDEGRRVSEPDYWFMRLSLLYSNIYDTISRRLGMALLAQRRISGYNSGPLEDNHWMSEVEMLFSTSLARIQFDAWSIASGEGHDRDGYIDGTPLEAGPPGSLCGLFKFKTRSHKNINLVWFIAAVALLPFLWFITLEGDNSFFSWAWGWLKPFIASLYCYSSKTSSSSSAVEATRPSGYSTFRSDSNTRGQTSPPASRHSAYSSGRQRQRPEGQHQPNVVTSLLSNTAANGTLGTRLNTPESRDHDNNPQTEVDDVQNQSDTESDVTEQPISGPEDRASDDRSGGSVHPELKIEWRYLVLDVAIEALFLLPGWILTSIKHCTRHCASKRSQSARESNQ